MSSSSASPEGNRRLKNPPMFTCLSPTGSENEFGRHCRACRARGMLHTAALKATARKRLKVIYAVMRDTRPYAPRIAGVSTKGATKAPSGAWRRMREMPSMSMQWTRCFILPDH